MACPMGCKAVTSPLLQKAKLQFAQWGFMKNIRRKKGHCRRQSSTCPAGLYKIRRRRKNGRRKKNHCRWQSYNLHNGALWGGHCRAITCPTGFSKIRGEKFIAEGKAMTFLAGFCQIIEREKDCRGQSCNLPNRAL